MSHFQFFYQSNEVVKKLNKESLKASFKMSSSYEEPPTEQNFENIDNQKNLDEDESSDLLKEKKMSRTSVLLRYLNITPKKTTKMI